MKKRRRMIAKIAIGVVVVWLLGDFIYSRVVAYQVAKWEATIERDERGVWQGCGEYTLPAVQGVEDRGALLLVHGINASPRHYDKMAPALAERGYACRVMRLPGFAQPVDVYAQSRQADWIAAVGVELKQLRENHDRVGVVAHSLGAAVVVGHLLNEPESADFAALLAPGMAVADDRSPLLSTRAWHRFGNATLLSTKILQSPFGIDCHDPAHPDYPGRTPFTPRVIVDELFDLMDDDWRRIEGFNTPLLMVLSDQDIVIDWRAAKRYFSEVPVTEKQLLMLKDSGHAIPIDYGWQESVEAIAAFDRQLTGKGPPPQSEKDAATQ